MIVDLTLTSVERRDRDLRQWKDFFFSCDDMDLTKQLLEVSQTLEVMSTFARVEPKEDIREQYLLPWKTYEKTPWDD